jgi:hypothetical protein
VHHMMTVLLSVKMIDVLFECAMYAYIAKYGQNSAWNACVTGVAPSARAAPRSTQQLLTPAPPPPHPSPACSTSFRSSRAG